ncbi:hypothetical protein F441_11983 [Phytophthora nicotianae CJ01A1]|uniref:Uncharacterized protein n=4 Tax=Phytophthora nicotianae TaxID=4792 RepID=W2PZN7_PHYN3|nr:hypothetical protein PPTG_23352 [Phytophthora nicotianae INRA-310]ETI42935.1 hypothetical protein F443_12018 [Phytophthora nicotianae P1569]ETM42850.1 hypothetical protein L914_11564 [Phytophthora nicotianae]ETN06312.1 hypothetical protein PPTG_23352 [Phytophthora nicotianae INRA-310]ETP12679.1 hypothetical protein F441_11983 [Phytophthora nicotianae CJ01A1]
MSCGGDKVAGVAASVSSTRAKTTFVYDEEAGMSGKGVTTALAPGI